jgi:hypothetical protein
VQYTVTNEVIGFRGTKRQEVTILFPDRTISNNRCLYRIPMTPQAILSPALPVLRLSSVPPFPRSSILSCTTRARPMMLCGPCSEIRLSVILTVAKPVELASMLPRSPTWRSVTLGAPWFFCEETIHGDFIIRSVFCVLLQVTTEVPEQGHISVTLQAEWVIKRTQNNVCYSPSYISHVICAFVHEEWACLFRPHALPQSTQHKHTPRLTSSKKLPLIF